MAGIAVRVPKEELNLIIRWAEEQDTTPGKLIADWAREHEERLFWEQAKVSVARAKQNEEAWQEMQEEQRLFDNALLDGLGN